MSCCNKRRPGKHLQRLDRTPYRKALQLGKNNDSHLNYFSSSDPHHDISKQPRWHHPRCRSVGWGLFDFMSCHPHLLLLVLASSSSSSSSPPLRPSAPAYLQNVQWHFSDIPPSVHSSTSPFLQITTWCTLLWRCTKPNCFNNNVLEMRHACFFGISCRSIPTNTVFKFSAKSLGGNSLMACKVGACSMMVVARSSPHAERDRSHVGRERHLCENYPAQRQHHSVKMGIPPAFFAQLDKGACSLPARTPSVRRRRRTHLGFVTCWQLNNWTKLEDLFKWHLWPSCNIQIRV